MSDLISRNALIQHAYSAVVDGVEKDIIDLSDVDNAPTVPLPNFKEGYKQAIIDGKTNFSRPQGEWKVKALSTFPQYQPDEYFCPFCNTIVNYKTNFCSNCGADMRKEG